MKDLLKVLLLLALTIIGMFACSRRDEVVPAAAPEKNVLKNDNYSAGKNAPVQVKVLENDKVAVLGTLVFKVPANGTIHSDSSGFFYQPNPGFAGTEAFYYRYITDNGTDSAKVSIRVQ